MNRNDPCLRYALVVLAAPGTGSGGRGALRFARALLDRGHRLVRVFFYRDGAHTGNRLILPSGEETDLAAQWSALADEADFELVLCVGAAERRGVLDTAGARRAGRPGGNLADGFRIAGLGQLIDAVVEADRVVCFAD